MEGIEDKELNANSEYIIYCFSKFGKLRIILFLIINLCCLKTFSQNILFDALSSNYRQEGVKLTKKDSIAGNQAFIVQQVNDRWYFQSMLRCQGERYAKGKFTYRDSLLPPSLYAINALVNPCEDQKVICMGYYKAFSGRREVEFFAIRLTDDITFFDTLELNFKFISDGGGVFDLYTNNKPHSRGGFKIDELVVFKDEKAQLTEYKKNFSNRFRQKRHDWLIIVINNKKGEKLNLPGNIAFMSPKACACPDLTSSLTDSLAPFSKTKPHDLNFIFSLFSYEITSYDTLKLNSIITYLKQNETINIEFIGHTDNTGNPDDNVVLSVARAKSVFDLFVLLGIKPERMQYRGVGDKQPIASNQTLDGQSKNRRVEVWLY